MSELQEPMEIIEEGDEFALFAYGNNSTYVLRSKADKSSTVIEGEDEVATFRHDYDEIKSQYPTYNADQILAQLWDQGGYGWMAVADDE